MKVGARGARGEEGEGEEGGGGKVGGASFTLDNDVSFTCLSRNGRGRWV